jgi:hypothetical protein
MGADLSRDLSDRRRARFHRRCARSAQISKILFFLFLVIFIVIIILAIAANKLMF